MADTLFLIFTYFVEALIVYFYSKSLYKAKKSNILSLGIIIGLYGLLYVIFRVLLNNEILNIVFIIITNMVIIYFLFQSTLKSAIFHGAILGILQLLAEFFTSNLTAFFLNISSQESVQNHFEIGALLSMTIYFLLTRLLTVFSIKENSSRSWGKWFSLSILPAGSIFVIIIFRIITKNVLLDNLESTLLIIAISILLLINIIIYMIYEQAEENNQKLIELELINQKNDIDMHYLELLEKKNETMNIMAHDYKNNILTIANMSDSNEVKEYINNMIGEIAKYNHIAKTKNKFLDVILSKYTDICNNKGIRFETDIMTENLSFINSYDLSSLFNNILDNAVEAASVSADKLIHLEVANSINLYHKIIATNSCDNEPHSEKGKLITIKKNKEAHGFGTKSIRKIINKYGGELQWEYNDELKQFKLIILFPCEK